MYAIICKSWFQHNARFARVRRAQIVSATLRSLFSVELWHLIRMLDFFRKPGIHRCAADPGWMAKSFQGLSSKTVALLFQIDKTLRDPSPIISPVQIYSLFSISEFFRILCHVSASWKRLRMNRKKSMGFENFKKQTFLTIKIVCNVTRIVCISIRRVMLVWTSSKLQIFPRIWLHLVSAVFYQWLILIFGSEPRSCFEVYFVRFIASCYCFLCFWSSKKFTEVLFQR